MRLTRRDFIKDALLLGCSLRFSLAPSYAYPEAVVDSIPAYEKLEWEGKQH